MLAMALTIASSAGAEAAAAVVTSSLVVAGATVVSPALPVSAEDELLLIPESPAGMLP